MKLKELKPGMVIKCESKEESTVLWHEIEKMIEEKDMLDTLENFIENTGKTYKITADEHVWEIAFGDEKNIMLFKDLIIPEKTLTAEEAIELLFEKYASDLHHQLGCIRIMSSEVAIMNPKEIVEKLTEYKQSKQIHIVSKAEYNKIASDKLDELYKNGWRLAE